MAANGEWPDALSDKMRSVLVEKLGWSKATTLQAQIIDLGLNDGNVNICANKAVYSAGRTTGALIVIAHRVLSDVRNGLLPFANPTSITAADGRPSPYTPYALILVHTRDLTRHINTTLRTLLDDKEELLEVLHEEITRADEEKMSGKFCVATPRGLMRAVERGVVSGSQLKYVFVDDSGSMLNTNKFDDLLQAGLWPLVGDAQSLHEAEMRFMICTMGEATEALRDTVTTHMIPYQCLRLAQTVNVQHALRRINFHFDHVPPNTKGSATLKRFFDQWMATGPFSDHGNKKLVIYVANNNQVDSVAWELKQLLQEHKNSKNYAATFVARMYGVLVSGTEEGKSPRDNGFRKFQDPDNPCCTLVATYMSSAIQFVNNPNICCLELPITTQEEPGTARVQKWFRAVSRAGTGEKNGEVWTMLRTWERQVPYDNGHIEIDDKTVVSKIVEQMEELQIPVPQDLTEGPDLEPLPPSRAYQTDRGPASVPAFMAPIVARAHASANRGSNVSQSPVASAASQSQLPALQGAPIGRVAA
ncbi:hypothetical protein CB0940_09084 [Cercospora beticola]|uniref:ATP-dependent RNA helicase n=1 Tax=Cercospora beticola TaxID=122368 RepID=A0A2G5HGX2_CERBT|nr:hypothetical protein CB0940_09084 [Cercospora beticola]PIA91492.1 hypothetical protein CB0940_09084 [Cercospora beticola]WPB06635.1 hypothetical protein RHO25_011292 [Cercospora beticola]